MSLTDPRALHEAFSQELAGLLELVLAGDLAENWAAVERQVVRVVGALVRVHRCHTVDKHGRCLICRAIPRGWRRLWPWPKRTTCTVHNALGFFMCQPDRFVLAAINDDATVRERS
ncbi:MAG: hypothetical protein ACRDSR_12835 [Pseudonocardiaceae bacterium]